MIMTIEGDWFKSFVWRQLVLKFMQGLISSTTACDHLTRWPEGIHITWLSKSRLIFMRIDNLNISQIYYRFDVSLSK